MLRTELEQLEHADLIRRAQGMALAQAMSAMEYWFKHGLVQESTYESLLKQDRRRLHRYVAETMERAPDFSADEFAPLLAKHWDDAEEPARAFGYYVRAGDMSAHRYANVEALMAYDRALALAANLDVSNEELLHLYTQRGRAYELNAQYTEALANYAALERMGHARGDHNLELAALLAQIPIYATPNARFDYPRAAVLLDQALNLARELNDRAAEAKALWLRMLLHARNNQPQNAAPDGDAALALARALQLRELTAYVLNDMGGVYVANGDFDRGRALMQEANGLWRELDNLPMLADNLSSTANFLIYAGELDTVFRLSDEAYQITERIGNLWGQSYSLMLVGLAHIERGDFALGMSKMRECIKVGDRAGFMAPHLDTQLDLARAHLWLGATETALHIAQRALREVMEFPLGMPVCYSTLVECYTAAGDFEHAAEALARGREALARETNLLVYQLYIELAALELADARGEWEANRAASERLLAQLEKFHVRLYLADTWLYRARALAHLGETTAAFDAITQAETAATALGSRRIGWQILAQRAAMEQARGNTVEANRFKGESQAMIDYIAQHAPPELRAEFLKRAERAVGSYQ